MRGQSGYLEVLVRNFVQWKIAFHARDNHRKSYLRVIENKRK